MGNPELFKRNDSKHNKAIYQEFLSYVQIDPHRLPEKFVELFNLDPKSPTIQNDVEEIFQRARLLDPTSARVIFVDGKIIIFRNEERLIHQKETRKLTQ